MTPHSFSINHLTLKPGIYKREVYLADTPNPIQVWDIRVCEPSLADSFTPGGSHVAEHVLATAFRALLRSHIVYLGPMGCLTGFYLLTTGIDSLSPLGPSLQAVTEPLLVSLDSVPHLNPLDCGNPTLHDLPEARRIVSIVVKLLSSY